MRRHFLFIMLLISIQGVSAWDWPTHQNIVERVYYSLPDLNLSLEYLKEGSIIPDKVFHDNRKHHYPDLLELTEKWLLIAEEEYKKENFKNASLAFGIASHYITDSFSSPHYIKGETSYQHSKYEERGYFEPNEYCRTDIELKEILAESPEEGLFWESWLENKDNEIPENAVNKAAKAVYISAFETFNVECDKKTRIISKDPEYTATILLSLVILILLSLLIKRKD